jgi:acyl dehydratase
MFETEERVFSEKDLLLGILWEGDSQLHTNAPAMAKTPFGSTIVHGNSVTSMVVGQLLRNHLKIGEKVTVKRLNISYVGAVQVGDRIKGIFEPQQGERGQRGEILHMNFQVLKNEGTRVSKGTITIQID